MDPLPNHLRAALGRGHTAEETLLLVARLEEHGVEVIVRRLQLGNMKGEGFGTYREIYRTTPIERTTA